MLGVWVTMLLMIPILLSMYIRIYRVKRVFELYEKFLEKMAIRSSSIFSTYGMNSQSAFIMQGYQKSSDCSAGIRFDSLGMELTDSKEKKENGSHRQTIPPKRSQKSSGSEVSESQRRRLQSENFDDKKSILKSNITLSVKSIRTSSQDETSRGN